MSVLPISRNTPPRDEQPQRRVDELAGQRIEHHVDAAPAGHPEELLLEVQAAGVTDVVVVEAHRAQRVPLGRLAVVNTSRPQCRASWTAARPTPPVAAWISTDCPGLHVGEVAQPEQARC